jgi:hypothetical protein
MKRNATIIKDINKMFPPVHKDYPVCFEIDGYVKVTSESYAKETVQLEDGSEDFEVTVIDYYGEFRGGYPWANPKLESYLEKNGLRYEWDNPGAIALFKN